MASRVNVSGVKEARVAATALRGVDAELRKTVNKQVRSVVNPVWQDSVKAESYSAMDKRVLGTGVRVNVGARPMLVAASSTKALSGGLVPAQSWTAFEFGGARNKKTTYTGRSPKGKRYSVTRRTKRQLPERTKAGRALYPAVAGVLPRVASLWSQTSIFLIFEALKKGE